MSSVHGLQILMRVPCASPQQPITSTVPQGERTVRIINDDSIGRLQIQTETAGAGREQKEVASRQRIVELLEQVAADLLTDRAIEADVVDALDAEVILNDVLRASA